MIQLNFSIFSAFWLKLFLLIFCLTSLILSADAKYLKAHDRRKEDCSCVPEENCDDYNDNIEIKMYGKGKVAPR